MNDEVQSHPYADATLLYISLNDGKIKKDEIIKQR